MIITSSHRRTSGSETVGRQTAGPWQPFRILIAPLLAGLIIGACGRVGGDPESFCAAVAAVPIPLDQAAIARDGDLDNAGAVVLRLEAMADEAPRAIAADAQVLAEIGAQYTEIVHRQATGQTVSDEELAAFDLDLVAYGEAAASVANYASTTCGIDLNAR